jgi:hypothetical protein
MWKVYAAYVDMDNYVDGYDEPLIWKLLAWNIDTKRQANDIAQMLHSTDWDIVQINVTKK